MCGGVCNTDVVVCVTQVGGIKEKVLAAHRAGVEQVIMPKRCEKDLHEVPDNVKVEYSFYITYCS